MTKIFVYATNLTLAEQTVQILKTAGAEYAQVLNNLNIPSRQPKEHRYIFICETPAEMLSALAPKVLPEADYALELAQWYEAQNKVVTAATAQKKRSIVVTSAQLYDTKGLLASINDQWGLSLKAEEAEPPSVKSEELLLAYLVQNLIEQTGQLQALQSQINSLAGIDNQALREVDALTGYRGLVKQRIELQSQSHQLASTQAELNNQLKDLKEENELLLAQLHTVQEELERIFLDSNKLREDAAKEKADLTAAADAQAKAAKEAAEEAGLLLNQLHQVQEELEHYFLKNQEAEAKLDKHQARWQRLLKNHPDYIDTESVQVELIDPTKQTLKWVVQGMESQGISKDYLEFDTFIESGILGILFNKTNSRNEPTLNNWPASCEGETIDCMPAGKGNVMRQRAFILRDLSASDWKLINTLPQLIKEHLCSVELDTQLRATISESATKFRAGLNALPKTFRYDGVVFKANQVNPDYEHLWFELHNASYDTYNWPKFEFRLGAANIKPGKFSEHPKLEIPLIDGKTKPFDSWFEESHDDYGGKYELRFDLKRGITDMETLLKVEKRDQRVISALVDLLPTILKEFCKNDVIVNRKAEDWFNLAVSLHRAAHAVR